MAMAADLTRRKILTSQLKSLSAVQDKFRKEAIRPRHFDRQWPDHLIHTPVFPSTWDTMISILQVNIFRHTHGNLNYSVSC